MTAVCRIFPDLYFSSIRLLYIARASPEAPLHHTFSPHTHPVCRFVRVLNPVRRVPSFQNPGPADQGCPSGAPCRCWLCRHVVFWCERLRAPQEACCAADFGHSWCGPGPMHISTSQQPSANLAAGLGICSPGSGMSCLHAGNLSTSAHGRFRSGSNTIFSLESAPR